MPKTDRTVHMVFGSVLLLLGGISLAYFFFLREEIPSIQPPRSSQLPADHPELPENHPPLDYGKELMTLEELSRNDPRNAGYKTRIGNIYYDTGQYAKAAEAYQESLRLKPKDQNVETDLATCLHYLGQHDKALEILENVLGYSPNFSQALFNKGIVLFSGKNDPKGAIAAWEELLRVNPNLPQKADLEQRIEQLKRAGK